MATGTVKWFNSRKGYGFIVPDDPEAEDVFVHYTGIKADNDDEFRTLYEGDKVEYEIVDGPKGPQASEVLVTEAAPRKFKSRSSQGYDSNFY
ncbi:MAG: cold-shock protein [Candidatus Lokiarchaeota archaeon]|nr:cold-shock protein [Candidatus Lokiarchaeota archaeon]